MIRKVSLALGAMLVVSSLSTSQPARAAQQGDGDTYRLLNLFGDAFDRARRDYVDEVTDQQLIENAVNGMLSQLDPHSGYLNAKNYKEMQVQTRGEFGGLGIEVTMENGWVKVVSPIDDTPASRAGIKPGDFITHLDGAPVLGLSLNEAVDKMRGPANSDIRLTIRRGGKNPFDISLTRAVVKIQSVRSRTEGDLGYIRITQFTDRTKSGLVTAIHDIKERTGDKLKGYVLDLRNNPGGLLDQAIEVSDAFLDHGEIVSTRSRRAEDIQRYSARTGDLADGLPVVVLINDGSASAAEIVAGALQDHHRAVLIGTKSFGKGSVQTIIPLQGYGAMRLTTARYYTPSGRSIQAIGIQPDILVEQARLEPAAGNGHKRAEADLRHALSNNTVRKDPAQENNGTANKDDGTGDEDDEKTSSGEPQVKLGEPGDYQLSQAFDLLRGLSLRRVQAVN
ncbi:MAG: S41 family peptidase [Alphaproteobacteria bacterium]|nr:S41 family peptidase [Alphaproteobacteria bacterium]MBF0128598.1 S41 family peptidase [Alphaproteobacteria bacterium]